jgi:hypothetical protein
VTERGLQMILFAMRFLPLALAAAIVSPTWAASDLPRFDVDAHCEKVAAVGGSRSEVIFGGCMDMEQQSYDGLKAIWTSLPDNLRAHCEKVGRVGGGNYVTLLGCVEMEQQAEVQNAKRSFKY